MSDADTIREFNRLYWDSRAWQKTYWLGQYVLKYPTDMVAYQEILWETRPEILIECGTYAGGSAWFFASIMDAIGCGVVLTIDPHDKPPRPSHNRISYHQGSSTDAATSQLIKQWAGSRRAMVVLDSDHSRHHVLRELEIYAPLVSPGCYLVVEDTNIGGHPAFPDHGPGPHEALAEWLPHHPEFEPDTYRERFLLTANPGGWLKRK
jgi:cephalosporin hydroxylase